MRYKTYLASALLAVSAPVFSANWLQFGYDQKHSGSNPVEHGYSTAGNLQVYQVTLPITSYSLQNSADGAPVFLENVATPNGVRDLLFLLMQTGALLALDAATGNVIWIQQPTGPAKYVHSGPAIDPNLLYVYAVGFDGKVHKYNVGDGTEIIDGHWPEVSSAKPDVEDASSALSIATDSTGTSFLYSVVNGYFDGGDYQGHITAINLSTGAQNVFNSQCSNLMMHLVENGTPRVNDCDLDGAGTQNGDGQMSGIWGRPGVVYDADTDRIYFATGNGLFDANTTGGHEWGDSVIALRPDGTGSGMGWPTDSYTPLSYATLYSEDIDLGATSPAILPSASKQYPHLAIQTGKDYCVRLINLDNMSGAAGPGHVGGELADNEANGGCASQAPWNGLQAAIWVNPSDSSTWIFSGNGATQLAIDGTGNPSLFSQWAFKNDAQTTSPVIANGTMYYVDEDFMSFGLKAVDAATGNLVWSVPVPNTVHWQSPIVVNGHIYVTDYYGSFWSIALDGIFRQGFEP